MAAVMRDEVFLGTVLRPRRGGARKALSLDRGMVTDLGPAVPTYEAYELWAAIVEPERALLEDMNRTRTAG